MEHVTSVLSRIQAIEARVRPEGSPDGFAQTLARVAMPLDPGGRTDHGRAVATAPSTGRVGITLAQMLGRPLSPTPSAGPLADHVRPAGDAAPSGAIRRPVAAPLSSRFGPRVHPVTGEHKLHAGIDLGAPTGTPIGAAAAGTVTFAGVRGGYGNLVIVDHGDGTESRYAHQATIAVREGQRVTPGALLGTVGSTGMSTGPHLHFELRRDGQPVDPAPLLGLT